MKKVGISASNGYVACYRLPEFVYGKHHIFPERWRHAF